MKVKEKINLPVDTQVLCVSHKCLAWAPQAWAGERGGNGEGMNYFSQLCIDSVSHSTQNTVGA